MKTFWSTEEEAEYNLDAFSAAGKIQQTVFSQRNVKLQGFVILWHTWAHLSLHIPPQTQHQPNSVQFSEHLRNDHISSSFYKQTVPHVFSVCGRCCFLSVPDASDILVSVFTSLQYKLNICYLFGLLVTLKISEDVTDILFIVFWHFIV